LSSHPKYPNPQIAEALCEFHFTPSADHPWSPNKPGSLFMALQDRYPEIEPISQHGIEIVLGTDAVPMQQIVGPQMRFRLKHAKLPFLLQISDRTFSINSLPAYPGWDDLKAEAAVVWPKFLDIVKPEKITRIGMRYINRIQRRAEKEPPAYWFQPCDFLPTVLLKSEHGFVSRTESKLDAENKLLITLLHDRSGDHGSVIFDLDRIVEKEIKPDWQTIDSTIETLHNDIWDIFAAAKGPNLEALLTGKL